MGRVKIRGLNKGMKKITKGVENAVSKSLEGCMKDLERVASETAPLDEGDLEQGGTNGIQKVANGYLGWVKFEAFSNSSAKWPQFNYAIWIHEEDYRLGPRSRQKAGGKGLSGKSYAVQKHYLTRPLEGEAETYRNIIEDKVKKSLGRME